MFKKIIFFVSFSILLVISFTNTAIAAKNNFRFFMPGPTDTICVGDTVTLSATNPLALSYSWTPLYNILNPNTSNPKVFPTQTTTYKVTIFGITNNLIPNGDFSQGNVGFTSGYTYTTNLWPEATYYIGTNPTTYHANFASCTDHTTGTGNMMIVNGAGTANVNIWQKNVTINPYSMYVFSCWLTSVTPTYPAQLQFFVNGVQIGAVFQATPVNCQWNMFYNTWASGAATTANIEIRNQNTALSGNDFALDDIYFAQLVEIYDSTKIIVDKPVISLGNDTSICMGDTVRLSPGNGFSQYLWSTNATTSSIKVSNAGNYWVKIKSLAGCKAADTMHLSINPNPVITTVSDTICIGDTAIISAAGANTYLWNTADTAHLIKIQPFATTNYTVYGKSVFGCKDTAQATVVVNPLPVVSITQPLAICKGNYANLFAGGGSFYHWNNGQNTANISVNPSIDSTYIVQVTDANGCKNVDSTTVSIIDNPVCVITADVDSICTGNPIVLTASGGTSYIWNNGDHNAKITVYPSFPTTYSCTATNTINGTSCSNTSKIDVYVENCNTFYIPNAFSSKSLTDRTFKPKGMFAANTEYYFVIYNRWGQLLFETRNYEIGWDGTFKGNLVQPGVYVYYVKVRFGGKGPAFEKSGSVTLVD
ncbi:MAG: gliding motility-associated C-terminal domain-containing protein [Bacteroidetes bacterium]|nr:gliding motility-associated C-terminal domain-containing protein [Bacteroidota bacterium]